MKKFLILLLLFPFVSNAAVTTITEITANTVTIRVQADPNPDDFGDISPDVWSDKSEVCIDILNMDRGVGLEDTWSNAVDIAFYADFSVTIPVDPGRYTDILIAPVMVGYEGQGCNNITTGNLATLMTSTLENPLFTITSGGETTGSMENFNTGIGIATASTTAMLASMGFAGVKVLFALLSVAIIIILLYLGFRYGLRAMQGKTPEPTGEVIGTYKDGIYEIRGKKYKSKDGGPELIEL